MADSPAKKQFPTFIYFFFVLRITFLSSAQKPLSLELFDGQQKHFLRWDSFSIGGHRTSLRYFCIVCVI